VGERNYTHNRGSGGLLRWLRVRDFCREKAAATPAAAVLAADAHMMPHAVREQTKSQNEQADDDDPKPGHARTLTSFARLATSPSIS
jgi:hypothetical protein